MSDLPKVLLKPKHAQPFYARHPWVFAGSTQEPAQPIEDGAEVDVVNHTGSFVARGLYNSKSKIRVRLYSWDQNQYLTKEFWRRRIEQALHLRREILQLDHSPLSAFRVVFGESDFMSGIVVDKFADYLAMQITSLGIGLRKQIFIDALADIFKPKGIYLRTEKGMGKLEGMEIRDDLVYGEPPAGFIEMQENNLRFMINLTEGQKTGYYLDQRENRLAAAKYCQGKTVLDAFCYSGGFGMYAAKAGASQVLCVDASTPAIELAKQNAALNQFSNVEYAVRDVFDFLSEQVEQKKQFDVVVIDPPKFARDKRTVPDAIRGYRRLHSLALKLLPANGILVSCCCSGLVSLQDLEDVIAQCAVSVRRDLQILERRGPAIDHPVAISCRESGYLKCVIARML